jgi:hypothetical protein
LTPEAASPEITCQAWRDVENSSLTSNAIQPQRNKSILILKAYCQYRITHTKTSEIIVAHPE